MPFQVLSLSGGGFLGLYTACVLASLEEHSGRPIASHFDLIAGTSIGGIIALGIAAGKPATEIRDAFIKNGSHIFSDVTHPLSLIDQLRAFAQNTFKAKYSPVALRSTIESIVGNTTRIGDLAHCVMIPTVNLTKGAPQVFKTDHHPTFVRDWRIFAVDVALATSAAPTFFPLHNINGELFADGGLYANAPDHLALHEAEHFFQKPSSAVRMLSIGTTTSKFSFSNSSKSNLGWKDWLEKQRLPRVMISAQQINAEYMLKHRLADNYLRIDNQQSAQQEQYLALDSASAGSIADLRALAEASVREHLGKPILHSFLNYVAPAPKFFSRSVS